MNLPRVALETQFPLLVGRFFIKIAKDQYNKGGTMPRKISQERLEELEEFKAQMGFEPLNITGLLEYNRYLINKKGFVMDSKYKRGGQYKLLAPKVDKEGTAYTHLRTIHGETRTMNIEYLLENNHTFYKGF